MVVARCQPSRSKQVPMQNATLPLLVCSHSISLTTSWCQMLMVVPTPPTTFLMRASPLQLLLPGAVHVLINIQQQPGRRVESRTGVSSEISPNPTVCLETL